MTNVPKHTDVVIVVRELSGTQFRGGPDSSAKSLPVWLRLLITRRKQ